MPRLGFVGNGKVFAARLLNDDEGYHYVVKLANATAAYWLATPTLFGDQWSWQFTIKPTNGKHFPYGREVEPTLTPTTWLSEGDT